MHEQFRSAALQSPERPDTFFAFVTGLYAATLVSPAAIIGLGAWVSDDAGVLYFGMLAAITLIVSVVTWGVRRWRGLPERLGASSLSWGLALVPVFVIGLYFLLVAQVDAPGADAGALVGFFLGLLGILVGIGLAVMARNRYTAAVIDESVVTCEWTAGWPEPLRTRLQYLAIVGMLGFVGALVLHAVSNVEWVYPVAQALFVPAIALANLGQPRTYRATPAGLERRYPASRYVYGWDAFEGYTVTDDTIVIHWRSWWRPALQCARADLDDEQAVQTALTDSLPLV
ncbi:MAG: hypothetical protein ABEI77_01675 [Halorientalis sp.]